MLQNDIRCNEYFRCARHLLSRTSPWFVILTLLLAKDLPRCSGFTRSGVAPPPCFGCMGKSLRGMSQIESFREVLRPKEGLRMTVQAEVRITNLTSMKIHILKHSFRDMQGSFPPAIVLGPTV